MIVLFSGRSIADRPAGDDLALRKDLEALSHSLHQAEMLLDDQETGPGATDVFEDVDDLVDDEGGKPFRGLVEDEDRGVGHQRPPDRQHLLLAAGKRSARRVGSFLEYWEERADGVQRPRSRPSCGGAEKQILAHGEIGQSEPSLRSNREP
jgi:hypothetical protein